MIFCTDILLIVMIIFESKYDKIISEYADMNLIDPGNLSKAIEILQNGNYILDVDYDFFFDREETVADAPWKSLSQNPSPNEFLSRYHKVNFQQVIAHDEALKLWDEKNISNATCIHIDHHHDWHIDPQLLDSASLGSIEGLITCGNYAAIASKIGIIKNFIWVYPDHHIYPSRINIPSSLSLSGVQTFSMPYSIFKTKFEQHINIENIKSAVMCLSPDFIPLKEIKRYFEIFNCDQEFIYRALDYAHESVLSDKCSLSKKYFRMNLSGKSITFFHGSPISGLKKISSEKGKVHVSPSSSFAACYGLTPNSNLGWIQGIDYISKENETVYLIPPKGQNIPKDYKTSLYLTSKKGLSLKGKGGCSDYDFISNGSQSVLDERVIEDVRGYLNNCGVDMYSWEASIDISLFCKSTEVRHAFSEWMEMPWNALLLMRSTPFFLMLFIQLRTKIDCLEFFPLIFWQRWAARCLYPLVPENLCDVEDDNYHGLSHGLEVGLLCVVYCQVIGISPAPVFLSALCHDLERNGKDNVSNAEFSAGILKKLLDGQWQEYSGENDQSMIKAIRLHPLLSDETDQTTIVLRDADRARLAWERGFNSKYFTSEIGSEIALNGSNYFNELETRLMFSDNVRMELLVTSPGIDILIWYLGRRYEMAKIDTLDHGVINFFIAKYNVSELIIFSENRTIVEKIVPSKIIGCPIHQVRNLSDSVELDLSKSEELYLPIHLAYCKDFSTEKSFSKILKLPEEILIHLEIGKGNLRLVNQNLIQLASMNMVLVYNSNPSEDFGVEFNDLVKRLFDEKKKNSDLASLRVITPYSWCWTKIPENASVVLTKARNSYSPLTFQTGQKLSSNVLKETLNDVRLRRERCHVCPFTINCLSTEYAVKLGEPESRPCNAEFFYNWNPYAAD